MTEVEFVIRLTVAFICGFVIGFERQWNHKSAGLKTNILVAMGAAMFVLLSIKLTQHSGDVTRIVGQVVTGVGFLGAGIIFKDGVTVKGLTTAATVWCSSAIGCLAAAGFYIEALICAVAIVSINTLLLPLSSWLLRKKKHDVNA